MRFDTTAMFAAVAALAMGAAALAGDPPANDDCQNAAVVSFGAKPFDTIGATTDSPELVLVCDQGNGVQIQSDVWFRWLVPGDGVVEISTCGGADFDTYIAVYRAPVDREECPGDLIDCSDDSAECGDLLSHVPQFGGDITVEAGEELFICVGSGDGSQGQGVLLIEFDGPFNPINDDCADALNVDSAATIVSTYGATSDSPDLVLVCDQGNGVQIQSDVWFRWQAPGNGVVEISTCLGADFDTYIAVYRTGGPGCPGPLIDCSDDSDDCGGGLSHLPQYGGDIVVDDGEELLICVGSGDGSQGVGELLIEFNEFLPPFNDLCENAQLVGNGTVAFTTEDATTDGLPVSCGEIESDVWFLWEAPCDGTAYALTCSLANFDTMLAVYAADVPPGEASDCCRPKSTPGCESPDCQTAVCDIDPLCCDLIWNVDCALAAQALCELCPIAANCPPGDDDLIGCNDDGEACSGTGSVVSWPVVEGEWFLVRLGGGTGAMGEGGLVLIGAECDVAPLNDDCVDRIAIGGDALFITQNATTDGLPLDGKCDQGNGLQIESDVWFSWTATCDSNLLLSTCGTAGFDTFVAVYETPAEGEVCPPGNDLLLGCSDDAACGNGESELLIVGVASGQELIIRIGGVGGAQGVGTLVIEETCVNPPPNDDCEDRIAIDGETFFTTVDATTDGLPLVLVCDQGNGAQIERDVWFSWTAPCAGTVVVSTCEGADFDTSLAIYRSDEDSCPSNNDSLLIDCSDDAPTCAPGLSQVPQFGGDILVEAGEEVIIRVGSAADQQGTGTLSVEFQCPCPEDVNGDGVVDVQDLTEVILEWLSTDSPADVNADGVVDVQDLVLVVLAWGACP